MRTIQHLFCGLLPLLGAAVIGCNGSSSSGEQVGSGQARIVLAAQGSQATTMHVTATNDATGSVALDKSVDLQANTASVIEVALDQATYTINVQAFDLGDATKVIGSATGMANLQTGETTEVQLTANSTGAGTGNVTVSVDMAPEIKNIQVTLATDPTSLGAAGNAVITVDAVDPAGGALTFFWSGLGLDAAVQGTSTLTISAKAAAASASSPIVHLVVQDAAGATTSADISFTGSSSCVICGASTTVDGSAVETTGNAMACLTTRAQCNSTCDAALAADPTAIAADVACLQQCGLDLATCNAQQ